jgi:hypothetical protein
VTRAQLVCPVAKIQWGVRAQERHLETHQRFFSNHAVFLDDLPKRLVSLEYGNFRSYSGNYDRIDR